MRIHTEQQMLQNRRLLAIGSVKSNTPAMAALSLQTRAASQK
jgi:hypothetical protein